jgi:hypothetical protein
MSFPLRSLTDWLTGVSRNRKVDKRRNRRRLLLESLEHRSLLASDLAAIAGIVFVDQTDDGLTQDDIRLTGVTVNLFRDGGDGQFGGDDVSVGSSVTDGLGRYRFDDLVEGVYFVQQSAVPGLLQRPGETVQQVVITAADADGTLGGSIDSFDVTTQTVEVSSLVPTSNSDSVAASEAIGGERDMFVELSSGVGDVEMRVRHLNRPLLSFSADSGAEGRGVVTWDGPDNDADQLDADGLAGYDLTENGANLGIRLLQGADLPGGLLTLRVYTDAGNFSTISQAIPQTPLGTAEVETIFWFTDFAVSAGSGADFTDVGAIELEIQGVPSMDAQIDELGMIGPTVLTRNFANLEPLSLGDTVWFDANNNGQLDAGELGIPGVVLTLYEDTDGNGEFTPGVDVALGTDTTDASGIYGFGNLVPRRLYRADRPGELRDRRRPARAGLEHRQRSRARSERQRRRRRQWLPARRPRRGFVGDYAQRRRRTRQQHRPRSQRQSDARLRLHRAGRFAGGQDRRSRPGHRRRHAHVHVGRHQPRSLAGRGRGAHRPASRGSHFPKRQHHPRHGQPRGRDRHGEPGRFGCGRIGDGHRGGHGRFLVDRRPAEYRPGDFGHHRPGAAEQHGRRADRCPAAREFEHRQERRARPRHRGADAGLHAAGQQRRTLGRHGCDGGRYVAAGRDVRLLDNQPRHRRARWRHGHRQPGRSGGRRFGDRHPDGRCGSVGARRAAQRSGGFRERRGNRPDRQYGHGPNHGRRRSRFGAHQE